MREQTRDDCQPLHTSRIIAECCNLLRMGSRAASFRQPAPCDAWLIRCHHESSVSRQAHTICAVKARGRQVVASSIRGTGSRGHACAYSMFIDILAREAIDSLSRAHAQSVERTEDGISDFEERVVGTSATAVSSSQQGKLFD